MFYESTLKVSKGALLGLLAAWLAVTHLGLVDPVFLPGPLEVARAFARGVAEENLAMDVAVTVARVAAGFALALAASLATAVLIYVSPLAKHHLEFLVGLLRYIPLPALLPLLVLWLGIGETEKIAVVFLAIYSFQTVMLLDQFKEMPREITESALLHGAGVRDLVLHVLLPFSWPRVVDTARVNIAGGWAAIALAEVVGASSGIGHLIIEAKRFTQTAKMFVGILLFAFFGVATDWAFKKIRQRFAWVG